MNEEHEQNKSVLSKNSARWKPSILDSEKGKFSWMVVRFENEVAKKRKYESWAKSEELAAIVGRFKLLKFQIKIAEKRRMSTSEAPNGVPIMIAFQKVSSNRLLVI